MRYYRMLWGRNVFEMTVRHAPTPNDQKYTSEKMRKILTDVLDEIERENSTRLTPGRTNPGFV